MMEYYEPEFQNPELQNTKVQVQKPQVHSSATPYLMVTLGILLLLAFIVLMILYFKIRLPIVNYREVAIVNKCTSGQNISINGHNLHLTRWGGANIVASAGVNLEVVSKDKNGNNGTVGILNLAGQNNDGPYELIINDTIHSETMGNEQQTDKYGVSLQQGYSVPMRIFPLEKVPDGIYTCNTQHWNEMICPGFSTGGVQCQSPCAAGNLEYCCPNGCTPACQNEWPNLSYYQAAVAACPTCMITNCDQPNFSCNNLAYEIVLCPDE